MKVRWPSRSDEEIRSADRAVKEVTAHLRVLIAELYRTLDRIEHDAGR